MSQPRSHALRALALALLVAAAAGAAPGGGASPAPGARPAPVAAGPAPAVPPAVSAPIAAEGAPASAPLSADAALARATAFYESSDYPSCERAFLELLRDSRTASGLSPRAREQAAVYRAACLVALGRVGDADEQFREAIRENPQIAVPNVVVFPQAVIERFIVVRTELLAEIRRSEEERARAAREAAALARLRAAVERRRVTELERLAAREVLVEQNSRWLASVPFGVGQFQNGDTVLGGVLLGTEVALLGTCVTAVAIELGLHSRARGGASLEDAVAAEELSRNVATARRVGLYSALGLLGVAALGVTEAHLSFVPERAAGIRERPLPPGLAPQRADSGASVTLLGRF